MERTVTEHRLEGPGENGDPVPRDLPDQQVHEGDDPWDVTVESDGSEGTNGSGESAGDDGAEPGSDVPDTDEAGTGRQGAPRSDTVHPEHPDADESTA
jgi:hypothetical protein